VCLTRDDEPGIVPLFSKYTLANFPEVRGMVASFLKPMDGLCAALYTQLHLFAVPTVPAFLLLQASLPPTVAIISLPFLRLFRDTEDSESKTPL
jgi:hypothetical protein